MRLAAALGLALLLGMPSGAEAAKARKKSTASAKKAGKSKKAAKGKKGQKQEPSQAVAEQEELPALAPAAAPEPAPAPVVAQPEPAPVAEPAPTAVSAASATANEVDERPLVASSESSSASAEAPAPAAESSSEPEEAEGALAQAPSLFVFPKAGVAFPQVLSPLGTSPAGALEVGYLLPVLGRRLGFSVEAAYTQPSHTRTVEDPRLAAGSATYTVQERTLGLYAGPKFFFLPLSSAFVPYAGAGVRAQMLSTGIVGDSAGADLGAHEETGTHLAFAGQLGAGLRLGPGHAVLEAQFTSSPIPHLITGEVDIGDVSTRVGYLLSF